MKPKVSIIITTYNRIQYLPQAIESCLNQTLKNIQIIIMDDGSTDKRVQEMILDYQKKYSNIESYRPSRNLNNIAILWNQALDKAKGEYICLLDDDNAKKPEFCQEMSQWLDEHQDYYAVACFATVVQDRLDNVTGIFDMPKHLTENIINQRKLIDKDNHVDSGCVMFRKSLIDRIGYFDERLLTNEDWDFMRRIIYETPLGFGVIQKELTLYRWHGKNRLNIRDQIGKGDAYYRKSLMRKPCKKITDILLVHQNYEKITSSQQNVLRGVFGALQSGFFNVTTINEKEILEQNIQNYYYDMIFIFAPFSIGIDAINIMNKFSANEIINFHIEDPQALIVNKERSKNSTYISTNDISVLPQYRNGSSKGSKLTAYCPSVSYDDIELKAPGKIEKKYDLIFYGYAYESRKRLLKQIEPELKRLNLKYLVVGGGWNQKSKNFVSELTQQESLNLLAQSKIVLLKNRMRTDLNGGWQDINPQSIVRGYFEAGAGSMILIDDSRIHYSFSENEIAFFKDNDKKDLLEKIKYYLRNENEREEIASQAQKKALTEWTYRNRIIKLVNSARSQRICNVMIE
jgi:glycosyltransferase involved in cell wall biosynthesis